MRTSKARWILFAACFLLFPLGASAGTSDSDKPWTTLGSVGTLDEKSEGKVVFDRARVQKGDVIGFKTAASRGPKPGAVPKRPTPRSFATTSRRWMDCSECKGSGCRSVFSPKA